MYGVCIGDIAGSSYEFSRKAWNGAELLDDSRKNTFTDDTVLTAAVCDAIMRTKDMTSASELRVNVRRTLQEYAIDYPFAGYGAGFMSWVEHFEFMPYHSFGNGGAMRVSPVAWIGKTAEEVFALSDICTKVTHDHPEGVKGARAVALAVYLARHSEKKDEQKDKEKIRLNVQQRFYLLDFTIDGIRESYIPSVTAAGTVPQAIEAFLEADSFESAIRNALKIGGDSDTLGAMAGAMAEAYYGVPKALKDKARSYLDDRLTAVFDEFEERYQKPPV